MIQHQSLSNSGYTNAVDWWSLGVSMYRLLTCKYPFVTEFELPTSLEEKLVEGSDRYSALLEDVDYSLINDATAVDCISRLLTFDDWKRMGYGSNGSKEVSSHPFFKGLNWIKLEKKQIKPPDLPTGCVQKPSFEYTPTSMENILERNKYGHWLAEPYAYVKEDGLPGIDHVLRSEFDAQLEFWDYSSPGAVLLELGENNFTL